MIKTKKEQGLSLSFTEDFSRHAREEDEQTNDSK